MHVPIRTLISVAVAVCLLGYTMMFIRVYASQRSSTLKEASLHGDAVNEAAVTVIHRETFAVDGAKQYVLGIPGSDDCPVNTTRVLAQVSDCMLFLTDAIA